MFSRRAFLQNGAALGVGSMMHLNATAQSTPTSDSRSTNAPAGSPNILIFMPDQQNGATVLPDSPVQAPTHAAVPQGLSGIYIGALPRTTLLPLARKFHERPLPL